MKKIFLSLLLAAVLTFVLCGCKKDVGKKSEDYEIGGDRLPSITFVLEGITQKDFKEENGELHYTYDTENEGYMDVYEYISYLIDNCSAVVTEALNEGEEGECEIAVPSEEEGYSLKLRFRYEKDSLKITVSRVNAKIKKM